MVQAMLADSRDRAARGPADDLARGLDARPGRPGPRGKRRCAKVFVAEAVDRVVDRAIQVCGALGDQRRPAARPVLPRGARVPHLRRPERGPPRGDRAAGPAAAPSAAPRVRAMQPPVDPARAGARSSATVAELPRVVPRSGSGPVQPDLSGRGRRTGGMVAAAAARGPLPPSAHDVLREHRILAALQRPAGAALPRPIAACDDPTVIGAPFFLMEALAGDAIRFEPAAGATPRRAARAIGAQVVDALAALHRSIRPPSGWATRPAGAATSRARSRAGAASLSHARGAPIADLDWSPTGWRRTCPPTPAGPRSSTATTGSTT